MAFMRRESKENNEEKLIEISAQMDGVLTFADPVNLKILGKYSGKLDTHGTLTIGAAAIVEADIQGDNIIIAGRVKGNVHAKKMLVLMPGAILTGNITSPKLNIVEGAIFQGNCQMLEEFLNIEDLSQYLEIEVGSIEELATSGKIPAIKDDTGWKFERVKIDQWAAAGKVKL